jgi:imidazoleglycerol-phosphate dehydratase / histidinol-phosphatase
MKKALFIDRDGTLIIEPPIDYQIDSLEKLEFYPGVFNNLFKIRNYLNYELVIVSNQDGMGSPSFPYENFILPHEKFITAFKNEGIEFDNILIDSSLPADNAPTRKPRTGLLGQYLNGEYDLASSFVIGDRLTDIELAKNLGAKGILLGKAERISELSANSLEKHCVLITESWSEIWDFLRKNQRKGTVARKTKETDILVEISLDGSGQAEIQTGLGFFDHMLDQIAKHSGCDLKIIAKGDLHVDEHHTIEDTGIALGEAFLKALGDKRGISRYGFLLPMDESLAQVALDFGGRNWLVWDVKFNRERVGDVPTEMFSHFFKSFSDTAKCNLNIKVEGDNDHHKIEGIFKAFAKCIKMAVHMDTGNMELPSTKGTL